MHYNCIMVTSKHYFSSIEFIPKDNNFIIDIITALKHQPQASVNVVNVANFYRLQGFFGAEDKKRSILLT